MKRILASILCILLCISNTGCGNYLSSSNASLSFAVQGETEPQTDSNPINTEKPTYSEVTIFATETNKSTEPDISEPEQESAPTSPYTDTADEVPTEPDICQTEPSEDDTTITEPPPTQTTIPSETDPPNEEPPEAETKPTNETTPPVIETQPEETIPPTESNKPTETEPPAETEPEAPTDPYTYPFNIEQIRRDCIAIGRSYGLILDESLTPGNSCWSGAETASYNTQGIRLKRLLNEMVMYYSPTYREDMGLPAVNITAFNIYYESTGSGTYRIYFLFLL